jgi:hypothetical protein
MKTNKRWQGMAALYTNKWLSTSQGIEQVIDKQTNCRKTSI